MTQEIPHFVRILLRSGGIALTVASILAIRTGHVFQGGIDPRSFIGKWVYLPQHKVLFKDFPPTFLFGLILGVIGIILFGLSLKRIQTEEAAPAGDAPPYEGAGKHRLILLSLLPFGFAILSMALFIFLEWKQIQGFLPVGYWVVSILAPGLALAIMDSKSGISLRVHLTLREWLVLTGLTAFLLVFYSLGFNSWKFSFIGDEYAYFWRAENIAKNGILKSYWFNADGVYRVIPESLSTFHAFWIGIWGLENANFGWRFGSSVLTLSCLFPLYLSLRAFQVGVSPYPGIAAFLGTVIFFFSELIVIWSRIGQQPNAGLFPIVFGTCALLAGFRRNSRFYFFLAGVFWGAGLILNILGPIIAGGVILSLLFFQFLCRTLSERSLRMGAILPAALVFSGLLIGSAPNVVQLDYYQALDRQYLQSEEDPGTLSSRIVKTIQTNFVFLHFRAKDHFLWGNVVDPITAWLVLLGFASWRLVGWRKVFLLTHLLIVFSFLSAGISHYAYLSVTRILHGMLPIAVLSSLGFSALVGRNRRIAVAAAIPFALAMGLYTVVKIEAFNPYQRKLEYIATFLKPVQEGDSRMSYALVFPNDYDPYIARSMVTSYGYEGRIFLFQESPGLLEEIKELISNREDPVSFLAMDRCATKAEVRQIVESAGATYLGEFQRYDQPKRLRSASNPVLDSMGKKILAVITLFEP